MFSTTPPTSDLCEIAFDSSLTTIFADLFEQPRRGRLRPPPAISPRRLRHWNAVGGDRCLRLGLGQHPTAFLRRPARKIASTASRSPATSSLRLDGTRISACLRSRPVARGRRRRSPHPPASRSSPRRRPAGCGGPPRAVCSPSQQVSTGLPPILPSLRQAGHGTRGFGRRGQSRRTVQHQDDVGRRDRRRPPRPRPCSAPADASPMMSTGLACDQVGGSAAFRRAMVAGESSASSPLQSIKLVDGQHARPRRHW